MPKALFYTDKAAKAEIVELEGTISTMETNATADAGEIQRLTGEVSTANESLSAAVTERAEAVTAAGELQTKLTATEASLATAQAAVTEFDAKVESAAQAKFAGLGGPPIAGSDKDEDEKPNLSNLTGFAKVAAAFAAKK